MVEKSFLHSEIGERVEQSDFAHATHTSQRRLLQSMVMDLIVGDGAASSQPQNFIISGFDSVDPYGVLPGTVITLNGGKAIIGVRETGEAEFGMVISAGALTRNYDVNGRPDGTYGVYVRGEFHDDRFLNRLFWNPLAVTPAETPRSIATRRTEDWSITVELVSPGPEWQLVATAVKVGAAVTLTDARTFFFDTANGNISDSIWGTANDRSTNTATYGIRGLRRSIMALAKQAMRIVGGTNWKADPQAGDADGNGPRSLTQLNDEKLARNGAQGMTGDLAVDGDIVATGAASILNALAVGTNLTVTGNATVAGENTAAFSRVLAPAPSPMTVKGARYEENTIHVQGYVVTDGGGGFTVAFGAGYTPSLPGANKIRITFDLPFVNANSYIVEPHIANAGLGQVHCMQAVRNAAYIEFVPFDLDGITPFDPALTAIFLNFHITGKQA